MEKLRRTCFVCKKSLQEEDFELNKEVYLPVCSKCKGTDAEKRTVEEYLDSMADGLVCGCI
ncbi:MAG: hypothetical protein WCY58_07830 [Mariniphaga sp.]|nr:hypothetical protein [Mariniphaga sp.]MDD4227267.1 hypothetical protein [Mariniphaga sp.]MDD4426157.1 hypothetical protein [Mariniphaga sp.]